MRVFLIGFMGSGKTHWGKQLARHTQMPFFDLDEEIVKNEKTTIPEIFHNKGEEYFRVKEHKILETLTDQYENVIISTGGGTPCYFNNIDFMKKHGKVIWLNTSVDVLVQRLLKDKHSRPLIKNISDVELKSFIVKKLQGRKFYYEQANVAITEDVLTLDILQQTIQQHA